MGLLHYSKILEVKLGLQDKIEIFPNPVENKLFVAVETGQRDFLQLRLTDLNGRLIDQRKISIDQAATRKTYQMKIEDLAPGVYLLTAITSNMQMVRKIVKK